MILKPNEAMMRQCRHGREVSFNPRIVDWCQLPEGHTGPCVFAQKRRSLPVIPATGHPITQYEIDAATGG